MTMRVAFIQYLAKKPTYTKLFLLPVHIRVACMRLCKLLEQLYLVILGKSTGNVFKLCFFSLYC